MKNASPSVSPEPSASNSLIPHILVVDDEPVLRELIVRFYCGIGYTAISVASGEEALTFLQNGNIDFVITDIQLPGMSGTELIAKMKENFPDVPIMAITGYADINIAVDVLKNGACDFISKPFDLDSLKESTQIALEKTHVNMEMRHLRRSLKEGYQFGGMLSRTPEMHRIFEIIRAVAPTDMTVSIEGETGTGKELFAIAVHSHSNRRTNSFVTINCAGFPESLLGARAFWLRKGAFTGAFQDENG